MASRPAFAPLAPRHIRRGTHGAAEPQVVLHLSPRWQGDLRLFLATWAAGFSFFLVLLS